MARIICMHNMASPLCVHNNHTNLPGQNRVYDRICPLSTQEEDAFALSSHGTGVAGIIAMVNDNKECEEWVLPTIPK